MQFELEKFKFQTQCIVESVGAMGCNAARSISFLESTIYVQTLLPAFNADTDDYNLIFVLLE